MHRYMHGYISIYISCAIVCVYHFDRRLLISILVCAVNESKERKRRAQGCARVCCSIYTNCSEIIKQMEEKYSNLKAKNNNTHTDTKQHN